MASAFFGPPGTFLEQPPCIAPSSAKTNTCAICLEKWANNTNVDHAPEIKNVGRLEVMSNGEEKLNAEPDRESSSNRGGRPGYGRPDGGPDTPNTTDTPDVPDTSSSSGSRGEPNTVDQAITDSASLKAPLVVITPCGHEFDCFCLSTWISNDTPGTNFNRCPMCRRRLLVAPPFTPEDITRALALLEPLGATTSR